MDTTTIGRVTIFAVLATALTLSIGVALAEEDIFSYRDDYKIDTAKLSDDENAAYPYVQKYAEERHISPALLMAIVKQESGFNPNAIGDGGLAIGYMQVHWLQKRTRWSYRRPEKVVRQGRLAHRWFESRYKHKIWKWISQDRL